MALASIVTIALTGAESTGKTTLAAALADYFNTEWVAEYLRAFVDVTGILPEEQDVYAIAEGHLRLKAHHLKQARQVLFLDTDLVTTCVYQRRYFGYCPEFIELLASENFADLYLFMQPDIPWEPDGIQRSGVEERSKIHELLTLELERLELPFVPINGPQDERLTAGIQAVERLLTSRQSGLPT